jgi:hypothetical protein
MKNSPDGGGVWGAFWGCEIRFDELCYWKEEFVAFGKAIPKLIRERLAGATSVSFGAPAIRRLWQGELLCYCRTITHHDRHYR